MSFFEPFYIIPLKSNLFEPFWIKLLGHLVFTPLFPSENPPQQTRNFPYTNTLPVI